MKCYRCEQAFSCVVVYPDDENSQHNCGFSLAQNPEWCIMALNIRDRMPYRPDYPQDDAGLQCSPASLQWVGSISRPADLLPHPANEEEDEECWQRNKSELGIRDWHPGQLHHRILQRHEEGHQKKDGQIPDLRSDSSIIKAS